MTYTVIAVHHGGRAPDRDFQTFGTIGDALSQACTYLAADAPWVAIVAGNGRVVRGDDLRECCSGKRTLNDDLTLT